jgi:hypothetical protein
VVSPFRRWAAGVGVPAFCLLRSSTTLRPPLRYDPPLRYVPPRRQKDAKNRSGTPKYRPLRGARRLPPPLRRDQANTGTEKSKRPRLIRLRFLRQSPASPCLLGLRAPRRLPCSTLALFSLALSAGRQIVRGSARLCSRRSLLRPPAQNGAEKSERLRLCPTLRPSGRRRTQEPLGHTRRRPTRSAPFVSVRLSVSPPATSPLLSPLRPRRAHAGRTQEHPAGPAFVLRSDRYAPRLARRLRFLRSSLRLPSAEVHRLAQRAAGPLRSYTASFSVW